MLKKTKAFFDVCIVFSAVLFLLYFMFLWGVSIAKNFTPIIRDFEITKFKASEKGLLIDVYFYKPRLRSESCKFKDLWHYDKYHRKVGVLFNKPKSTRPWGDQVGENWLIPGLESINDVCRIVSQHNCRDGKPLESTELLNKCEK